MIIESTQKANEVLVMHFTAHSAYTKAKSILSGLGAPHNKEVEFDDSANTLTFHSYMRHLQVSGLQLELMIQARLKKGTDFNTTESKAPKEIELKESTEGEEKRASIGIRLNISMTHAKTWAEHLKDKHGLIGTLKSNGEGKPTSAFISGPISKLRKYAALHYGSREDAEKEHAVLRDHSPDPKLTAAISRASSKHDLFTSMADDVNASMAAKNAHLKTPEGKADLRHAKVEEKNQEFVRKALLRHVSRKNVPKLKIDKKHDPKDIIHGWRKGE